MRKRHVVSIVFNSVEGDSRVIKTAQAALEAGYLATIIGVGKGDEVEKKIIEGVRTVLVPNFAVQLKKQGLWSRGNRDLRLLAGGQLKVIIPEVLSLQPDIIHSHDMIGLKIGYAVSKSLISIGYRVSWVHDVHEFVAGLTGEVAESYGPICIGWEREYLKNADHVFTVSDALSNKLCDQYSLPKAPSVVYNAPNLNSFDNNAFDLRSAIGLSDGIPLVVFIGVAKPLRGCDTILEAIASLDGVHLAFISQGNYVEQLKERASQSGFGNRVHIHQYVPSHQVTSFIRTADIGIHGLVHYPNAEVAMPNKMFEYLHAGLPLVVSDVESMKEFVESNKIGYSFIAEDAQSCAEAIKNALENKKALVENINEKLKETHSWEVQAVKIQNVYSYLLSNLRSKVGREEAEKASSWKKIDDVTFDSLYAQSLANANAERLNLLEKLMVKRLKQHEALIEKANIKRLGRLENLVMKELKKSEVSDKSIGGSGVEFKRKIKRVLEIRQKEGYMAALKFVGMKLKSVFF